METSMCCSNAAAILPQLLHTVTCVPTYFSITSFMSYWLYSWSVRVCVCVYVSMYVAIRMTNFYIPRLPLSPTIHLSTCLHSRSDNSKLYNASFPVIRSVCRITLFLLQWRLISQVEDHPLSAVTANYIHC